MNRQHAWISENGYASVETGAAQDNLAMTRLNHASGFDVVGIRLKDRGPEITYEKRLNERPNSSKQAFFSHSTDLAFVTVSLA